MRDEMMMNRKYVPWYLAGAAFLVAALLMGGVSGTAWVLVPIGLLCPLMMLFMMRGMRGGGSGGASGDTIEAHEHRPGTT
jgi:hypothetical protein